MVPEVMLESNQGRYALAHARRPLLLEVFATWCENCRAEVSPLNRLYSKYRSDIDFLAVTGSSIGADSKSAEDYEDVLRFAKAHSVRYPVAMDTDRIVGSKLQVIGFPAIFIVSAEHRIVYQVYGRVPLDQLDAALKAHLGRSTNGVIRKATYRNTNQRA